jgi:hypothetical protein
MYIVQLLHQFIFMHTNTSIWTVRQTMDRSIGQDMPSYTLGFLILYFELEFLKCVKSFEGAYCLNLSGRHRGEAMLIFFRYQLSN